MKLFVLAGLLLFLLTPRVHADEKPNVQVQFTYVDTPVIDAAMKKTLPSPKQTTGDALASFLRLVKNAHLHNKVTVGPEITTAPGVRAVLDKADFVSSASFGGKGADVLVGPRLTLTPTVVKDDLVSVVLSLRDLEIVGPDSYWFKKAQVAIAAAPPSFQAHSGSTILLAALYSSNKIERFTFATVTILPPPAKRDSTNGNNLSDLTGIRLRLPVGPAEKMIRYPEWSIHVPDHKILHVEITDADISADIVDAVSNAMKDANNRERLLMMLLGAANQDKRTFVIVQGVRHESIPRENQVAAPQADDKLSSPSIEQRKLIIPFQNSLFPPEQVFDRRNNFPIIQTLSVACRINTDETATTRLILDESSAFLPDPRVPPPPGWHEEHITAMLTFHDGETKLLSKSIRNDGIHHLIFATVTILPPRK